MFKNYAPWKVMSHILAYPHKKFSVREIARTAGVSVNAAKYSLDFLHENERVSLEKIGRVYQYKANIENPQVREWKIILTLEELGEARIAENILKTRRSILSIVLYGSAATGRDDQNSDIDLLVIADTDRNGKKAITACASGTQREPNISVYTPSEWRKKAETDRIFYERVIVDSIALYGPKPVLA